MVGFLSTVLLILVVFVATNAEAAEHYEIMKTWDNRTINHPPIKIELDRLDSFSFQIKFEGPLFKDPVNPPGLPNEPFYGLWEYEVVEVFFLNDAGQYVEIEVAPYGQYIVLLLDGYRNTIRHSLLIDVSTNRSSNTWEGTAIVPVHYLPPNVTKMNAYAIHGSGDNRTYEALYPVRFNSTLNPDSHNFEAFKVFDRSIILMEDVNTFSTIWTDSLDGIRSFTIKSRWNGSPLPASDNIQLYIDNNANESLILWIEAPFYNDPAPPVTPGPIDSFIDFEVVHLFLLNQNNLYLQISIGPYGHYKTSLMPYCESGSDPNKYPLSVTTFRRSGKWAAIATIPLTYLPPTVTKSNAGSAHGTGQARKFNSLYPSMLPDTEFLEPNYGLLQYYKALDFEMIFPTNKDGSYSTFWNEVVNIGACLNSAATRFNISNPFISMIILATIIWNNLLIMKLL